MKVEYILCVFVFILVIVVIAIKLTKNDTPSEISNDTFIQISDEKIEDGNIQPEYKKALKYFGGGYCPYSNVNSNAYKVIKEFEDLNKDVMVEYYWTEDNQSEMEQYKIMYVPTILGKDDKPIEIKLPDDFDKTGKTDAELKNALMEHIYSLV